MSPTDTAFESAVAFVDNPAEEGRKGHNVHTGCFCFPQYHYLTEKQISQAPLNTSEHHGMGHGATGRDT